MADKKLSIGTRLILCTLTQEMTAKQLAQATEITERHVKRILAKLVSDGKVQRTFVPGKATRYAIMSQDDEMSYDKMSYHDILTHDNQSSPGNARVHEAQEESLSLINYLDDNRKEKKEKDSVAKKTRRSSPSVSKPKSAIPVVPDSLRPRFELIAKLTDTSINSPVTWKYHHLLSGTVSRKRGDEDWYTYQIVGGLSDDALRQFIGYQKRQHELAQRPGKFFLRKPETINNLVNLWLDKRAAQDADRQQRAAYAANSTASWAAS